MAPVQFWPRRWFCIDLTGNKSCSSHAFLPFASVLGSSEFPPYAATFPYILSDGAALLGVSVRSLQKLMGWTRPLFFAAVQSENPATSNGE